ncbi:hypothetical protein [uncultured Gilliamella sp.]|uniref:hypothetical protein n=1 Tax=uncultured Gilliamella sp. TaxID=1193505 RepID=UPI0025DF0E34|nr:hypothetical protein [uncultured Gilliamella sp.]
MIPNYCYKFILILFYFFPLVCLGNQKDIVTNTNILKTINPNLSERKLNKLIMFDNQLSFISAFSKQNNANGVIPNTLNISNILQNILNRIDKKLMIVSQKVVDTQLPNNIQQKTLQFNIQEPTVNNESIKQINLSILIFNSNSNNEYKESYLLAEKLFLFSLFPTPFPEPDVKNISRLGTAAAKIFPQESNNFIWTYKNIFCSVKNSNTFSFSLSVNIAQQLQEELEKNITTIN